MVKVKFPNFDLFVASKIIVLFVNLKSRIDLEFDFVSNFQDPSRKKRFEK